MNTKELKNTLYEIEQENLDTLLAEVIRQALELEGEEIKQSLLDSYKDLGLKYDLDKHFFIAFVDGITSIIEENVELAKEHIRIDEYILDASWLAYQITLQNLLLKLELLSEDETVF